MPDPDDQRQATIVATRTSVERMQTFNPESLPRVDELGTVINFSDAVGPARRLIDLYCQLPLEVLNQLPINTLPDIQQQAAHPALLNC